MFVSIAHAHTRRPSSTSTRARVSLAQSSRPQPIHQYPRALSATSRIIGSLDREHGRRPACIGKSHIGIAESSSAFVRVRTPTDEGAYDLNLVPDIPQEPVRTLPAR